MAYKGSQHATHEAVVQASRFDLKLTEPLAADIVRQCRDHTCYWVGKADRRDLTFYVDCKSFRLHVVIDVYEDVILSVSNCGVATLAGIAGARAIGLELTLDNTTRMIDQIKSGKTIRVHKTRNHNMGCADVLLEEFGPVRISYSLTTGAVISVNRTSAALHKNSTSHATERAIERFGIVLTAERAESIISRIKGRRILDTYPCGNGMMSAVIDIEPDVWGCVIYDPKCYTIVTVTPLDYHTQALKRRDARNTKLKERKRQISREKRQMNDDHRW